MPLKTCAVTIFPVSLLLLQMCSTVFSGYDGTVRFWSLPNRIHQFLQHTCIFNRGEDISGEDLDGHLLGNVCWSSTGKLFAGSMDSLVNIWTTGGRKFKAELGVN